MHTAAGGQKAPRLGDPKIGIVHPVRGFYAGAAAVQPADHQRKPGAALLCLSGHRQRLAALGIPQRKAGQRAVLVQMEKVAGRGRNAQLLFGDHHPGFALLHRKALYAPGPAGADVQRQGFGFGHVKGGLGHAQLRLSHQHHRVLPGQSRHQKFHDRKIGGQRQRLTQSHRGLRFPAQLGLVYRALCRRCGDGRRCIGRGLAGGSGFPVPLRNRGGGAAGENRSR